ncbi:I78 family peptidase inhibitor [Paracoccus spongiarum]|uniref:I78 family peptidase inhibitor n=1 Tax=Paracoccus spongiarum TaxID=3064387 RepID=A0ABT9J987_9RHOB|nr:I78 family peptidase inhibitor [Paracoccus sp. 2205BS29-5]MDP5306371.1 I78 family peptidase inhibitor [Paracoccus sp. 2205BS29-5]
MPVPYVPVRLAAAVAVALGVAACQADPGAIPAPRCSMAQHQPLIGQNIGAVTLPARLPQRIISPGDQITEDFNPDRLNIFVDPKGWIARVSCG